MPLGHRFILLASQSPRRQTLLHDAGFTDLVVMPSQVDEEQGKCSHCGPAELVADLAFQKADDVARRIGRDVSLVARIERQGAVIVAGDTVAECGGQILGKPRDEDDARAILAMMSGERHRVYSGLCVWPLPQGEPVVEVDITTLEMDRLEPEMLETHLASGDWAGKAGAFGYQDGLDWVHIIEGSESNVVGLPLERLLRIFDRLP